MLAWLNANKSAMGALAILGLVIYAVFFPHPERGPREIAAEIMPSASRVNEFKGEPRDIDNWKELHKQYVEEIKLKVARKEVGFALCPATCMLSVNLLMALRSKPNSSPSPFRCCPATDLANISCNVCSVLK